MKNSSALTVWDSSTMASTASATMSAIVPAASTRPCVRAPSMYAPETSAMSATMPVAWVGAPPSAVASSRARAMVSAAAMGRRRRKATGTVTPTMLMSWAPRALSSPNTAARTPANSRTAAKTASTRTGSSER